MSGGPLLVAAFGDPGHAFPAIAPRAGAGGRGNEVLVETWERWREAVEGDGLGSRRRRSTRPFPHPAPTPTDGPSAADAALALLPMME